MSHVHWHSGWELGDRQAAEQVMQALHPQLWRMAARALQDWHRKPTLQVTELVHEAYLAMEQNGLMEWRSRAQFLAVMSRIMRNHLVDCYRNRRSVKRGGDWVRVPLELAERLPGKRPVDWMTLNSALEELETADPAAARVVELRFFAGLTVEEAAEVLGMSRATTNRRWRFARAWLHGRLGS